MFTRRTRRPLILSLLTAASVALSTIFLTAAPAVAAGSSSITVSPGQGKAATVATGKSDRSSVAFTLEDMPQAGGIYLGARARVAGKAYYMLQARVLPDGRVTVSVKRRDAAGHSSDISKTQRTSVTASAGEQIALDLSVVGASPVTLKGVVKNVTTGKSHALSATDRSSSRLRTTASVDAWAYGSGGAKAAQSVRVAKHDAASKPIEPAPKPMEPETKPAEPAPKPTEPETKPTEPEAKPEAPETKPSVPESGTVQPTPKPTDPETKPTEPAKPGKPGVPAGTKLTVHHGDLIITKANTVISGLDIRGFVRVNAPGVIIENSKISGRETKAAVGIVSNYNNGNSFTIRNSEIFSATPNPYLNGIMGHNFTATGVWVHDVIDSVRITGSNVTVSNSLLEKNLHFKVDPTQGNTPSHDDSIQIQGGSNIKILNNRISGAFNAAIQITQGLGRVSGVVIEGNYLDGGGCTINIAETGKGVISGNVVKSNTFGPNRRVAGCGVVAPTSSYPKMTGNLWESTGKSVAITRGN